MNPEPPPEHLNVPLAAMADLAVEHWRLAGWTATLPAGAAALARHALRRIEDTLAACDLSARSLDGRPFDPGMAVRVIDTIDDPTLADGRAVIAETLSPMVSWRGTVIRAADVVTRRGTGAGKPTE